jgi:putative transposase
MSRSSYYNYLSAKRNGGKRKTENEIILQKIKLVFMQSKSRYGSPRVTAALRADGMQVGKNRVARIMRENFIAVKTRHKRYYPKASAEKQISRDLVERRFNPTLPNTIWSSDITYIKIKQDWKYLSVIMDLYSRKIISWKLNDSQNESIIVRTIENAVRTRQPDSGIIFHSDRGSQYFSDRVKKVLSSNGILQSMGDKGSCYDNAVIESFFSTLKKELIYREKYQSTEELEKSLFEYIEIFYNRQRKHSTLGYLSPFEFESKNVIY